MKKILFLIFIITIQILYMQAQTFTLKSNNLGGQFTTENIFTDCGGKNISPQFSWSNPPKCTKSFALLMHDESAPTGSGWWHWLVFDIPNTMLELPLDAGNLAKKILPTNIIQSKTDYGVGGYGGPCPPVGHGFHKYTFTIYALNIDKLGLDENINPATVGFMVNANTIEKASIVAYFKR